MKTLIATACLVAIALAEPPPSNSYLPPPPAGRSGGAGGGYPSGRPQGVGARSFDHGAKGNGNARNSPHSHGQGAGAQGRFGGEQGYDHNSSPFGRNGHDDSSAEPANYNFGYSVNDFQEGTDFGHHEERQNERAEGEYHVVLPDGRKQTVSYEADERGFKPHISYEDSESNPRSGSGYDANAQSHGQHGNSNGGHGKHGHGNDFSNGGHGSHGNDNGFRNGGHENHGNGY